MKKTTGIIAFVFVCACAYAIPARREGMVRTAADGTEKTVYQHGDAFFHYMTDEAGRWLDETTLLPLSASEKAELQQAGETRRQLRRAARAQQAIGGAPNLAPRGLMIMVNFQNKAFVTPRDTVDSMLNAVHFTRRFDYDYIFKNRHYQGTITSSGSARQYFQDQSYGQYNPVFDVVGPYTVSQNYEYYGSNNDANVGYLIKEACELANADGTDFTLYDNNNDGLVDIVYVLYAGEGQADGGGENTIWPHNYYMSWRNVTCYVDGKRIENYACSNEINHYCEVYTGIGTFVHEFGHAIGLPDMYETNSESLGLTTLNDWDIMDYGAYTNEGNTPPAYSAYERFYCGWLTPRVLTDPEYVWLNPSENQEALLICSGDSHNLIGHAPNPATFYLLEARRQSGWDEYLPGEGMLITKIRFNASAWANNQVNNSESNMGIDLLEPVPNTTGWGRPSDIYPTGATQWTDFEGHEVTNIEARPGGAVTFSYRSAVPTATEHVQEGQTAYKTLRNGRVLIIRENKTYDILGNENHQL